MFAVASVFACLLGHRSLCCHDPIYFRLVSRNNRECCDPVHKVFRSCDKICCHDLFNYDFTIRGGMVFMTSFAMILLFPISLVTATLFARILLSIREVATTTFNVVRVVATVFYSREFFFHQFCGPNSLIVTFVFPTHSEFTTKFTTSTSSSP